MEADRSASRAIDLLRRAVRIGYANINGMKSDADLNAIRDRSEFKSLLLELEKKTVASDKTTAR
jgi:hypothetical protein